MNDRELLELAAKAAGYGDIRCFSYGCMDGALIRDNNGELSISWNPLTDDGDALRLAVKLRLSMRDGFNGTIETGNEKSGRPIWEEYEPDPYAATRRAIVRAAAEIGKSMK